MAQLFFGGVYYEPLCCQQVIQFIPTMIVSSEYEIVCVCLCGACRGEALSEDGSVAN